LAGAIIFHTSDLHNRLKPAAAEQIAALKGQNPGALLLDAGDAIAAGNLTFTPGGEPILRLMAEIGYDAMAMGNRESHPNRQILARKLRDARFPVLAANLVPKWPPLPSKVKPYAVFAGPPRVAVIGLAPQITRPGSAWARVISFVFENPVRTVAGLAPQLKREADLVVCLSHSGFRIDRELAAIPEVDLVLGGHSHRNFVEHEEGRAMVVHPGRYGSHISQTEIWGRDRVRGELVALESEG
jgi:2',3'-cyclic-nucleotide 2'-phosphodiesterase (5'-nucleotidase family)